jgi:hypothetical protein
LDRSGNNQPFSISPYLVLSSALIRSGEIWDGGRTPICGGIKRTCCTAARLSSSVRVLAAPGGGVTISLPPRVGLSVLGCDGLVVLDLCDSLTLCAPVRVRISCSRAVRLGSEYITGLGVGPGFGVVGGLSWTSILGPGSSPGSAMMDGCCIVSAGLGSGWPQSIGGKYLPDRISSRIRAASRRPSSVPLNRARLYASTSLAAVSGSIPYTGDGSLKGGIIVTPP